MLTKNLTPFPIGTKVCSRRPRQLEMTIVVRGTFALEPGGTATVVGGLFDQGHLTAEVLDKDDDERMGECAYGGDFADFKLNAEVLFKGSCHAPGGNEVTECPVLFRVGQWSKMLRIVGARVFTDRVLGATVSPPAPFTSVPLTWANAFGGPGHAKNPVGKGFKTDALPNVEHPGDVIRSRSDRPEPAGFGPINPYWPARANKRGKEYGRSWRAERAPFYSEDFDWTYFQAAPADQQLEGYLRGDEEIFLQNLHPTAPMFSARLPALRIRAFARLVDGTFSEAPMVLDTLLVDASDAGKGTQLILTWRGLTPVREDDLADVRTILVASEALADAPAPEAHYRAVMDAFEDDPVGLKEKLPPVFPKVEGVDPISAMLQGKLTALAADQKAAARDKVKASTDEAQFGAYEAKAAEAQRKATDTPPQQRVIKPGAAPELGLRRKMRAIMEQAAALKAKLEGRELSAEQRARIEQLEQLPYAPHLRQLDPTYTPPEGPVSTDEPGPSRDLSDRDFTGKDLRGLDLGGANLEGAILTRADLTGVKLAGARMRGAILYKTILTGADLTGADLTRVNAAMVLGDGATLVGATLEQAFFEDAQLAGALLSEATGEYAVFTRANLRGAKLRGVTFRRFDFMHAVLDEASFDLSTLEGCKFCESTGASVSMASADLTRASFANASLPGAIFTDCRGDDSIWIGAKIEDADFRFATLRRAHFTKASAPRARLFGANLRESRFYRAILDEAEFVRANLFSAELSKAQLNGTRFTGANLYDSRFVGASGRGADFTDANVKRSTLEPQ